ncbi:hypothetical protein AVEN_84267-1 [Araneus ventricosus]|uniref:Uncharacterized protein n=1 Tax=Araneus ventricosus TaxID=182803 RepID=A0A4Y2UH29_ARAVE|nr:hypothetical protein AVEN_84267-1 [Araneus ventricosus]
MHMKTAADTDVTAKHCHNTNQMKPSYECCIVTMVTTRGSNVTRSFAKNSCEHAALMADTDVHGKTLSRTQQMVDECCIMTMVIQKSRILRENFAENNL